MAEFLSAVLESSQEEKQGHFFCRQISAILKGVPDECKELFERNFQKMDISQKAVFADLKEFRNVFSEQITGNCDIMQHEIKLLNSRLIKQTPRKISIGKRAEVDEIIREMKSQGIIKEFFDS